MEVTVFTVEQVAVFTVEQVAAFAVEQAAASVGQAAQSAVKQAALLHLLWNSLLHLLHGQWHLCVAWAGLKCWLWLTLLLDLHCLYKNGYGPKCGAHSFME